MHKKLKMLKIKCFREKKLLTYIIKIKNPNKL